jgi:hypothetical protein
MDIWFASLLMLFSIVRSNFQKYFGDPIQMSAWSGVELSEPKVEPGHMVTEKIFKRNWRFK